MPVPSTIFASEGEVHDERDPLTDGSNVVVLVRNPMRQRL